MYIVAHVCLHTHTWTHTKINVIKVWKLSFKEPIIKSISFVVVFFTHVSSSIIIFFLLSTFWESFHLKEPCPIIDHSYSGVIARIAFRGSWGTGVLDKLYSHRNINSITAVCWDYISKPSLSHLTCISQNEGIKNGNSFGNYFTFFFMLQWVN